MTGREQLEKWKKKHRQAVDRHGKFCVPCAVIWPCEAVLLIAAIETFRKAADNGEWHNSEDCKVERKARHCGLCKALTLSTLVSK